MSKLTVADICAANLATEAEMEGRLLELFRQRHTVSSAGVGKSVVHRTDMQMRDAKIAKLTSRIGALCARLDYLEDQRLRALSPARIGELDHLLHRLRQRCWESDKAAALIPKVVAHRNRRLSP